CVRSIDKKRKKLRSLDRAAGKQAMESSPPTITVQVKFAGRTIPVEVPTSASTAELKLLLQPLTNVLPRGQKLICKGKVLADAASLSSMQVGDGSKVMLIASQGLHQGVKAPSLRIAVVLHQVQKEPQMLRIIKH
uniref:Ubiquitin-like domain-containing protein n=1 Tax=Aegilops tauschii subsp. strangulata TaxID=200361 RepID=A0A452YBM5_AEGTS